MTKDPIEETLAKYSRGLIMGFTGDGKGKTTAALGQALRALGHGKKVLVIQFMKGRKYGEVLCAEQCLPNLTVRLCGLDSFVMRGNPAPVDVSLPGRGSTWRATPSSPTSTTWSSSTRFNVAMDFGLVPWTQSSPCSSTSPPVSTSSSRAATPRRRSSKSPTR
jgi:cob(I)alamin adenosyltransferase